MTELLTKLRAERAHHKHWLPLGHTWDCSGHDCPIARALDCAIAAAEEAFRLAESDWHGAAILAAMSAAWEPKA